MADLYPAVIWAFAAVHVMGWTGGLLARVSARSRHQFVCHVLFFLLLVVVGLFTAVSFFMGTKWWLLSAATLAGMVLLAICDFDHQRRPATI